MGHPTVNPRRTVISRVSLPDAIQRQVTITAIGVTPAAGEASIIFRAPASGAVIEGIYVNPGSVQNHAVNEADTWTWRATNKTTGNALNAVPASLSNTTLAATAFKSLSIDNGYATMLSGQMLNISSVASGSPAALHYPIAAVEWKPNSDS